MTTIPNKLLRGRRRAHIESYEFPSGLRDKLCGELGSGRRADIALDGLRAWYLACLYADGELLGMPSRIVDEAWHAMILRTREYECFCRRAFGSYLHHTPDSAHDVPMSKILPPTLRVVEENGLPMVLFTADADAGYEGGYAWSSTELRRMRDAYSAKAERTRQRQRRRARAGAYAGGGGAGGGGGPARGGGGRGWAWGAAGTTAAGTAGAAAAEAAAAAVGAA